LDKRNIGWPITSVKRLLARTSFIEVQKFVVAIIMKIGCDNEYGFRFAKGAVNRLWMDRKK